MMGYIPELYLSRYNTIHFRSKGLSKTTKDVQLQVTATMGCYCISSWLGIRAIQSVVVVMGQMRHKFSMNLKDCQGQSDNKVVIPSVDLYICTLGSNATCFRTLYTFSGFSPTLHFLFCLPISNIGIPWHYFFIPIISHQSFHLYCYFFLYIF